MRKPIYAMRSLRSIARKQMIKLVTETFCEVIKILYITDKTGGYFYYFENYLNSRISELEFEVGVIAKEKRGKYPVVAKEKGQRLGKNYDDLSSYQTRNPERGKWGGAIRASKYYIFSFSGLPELVDEAFMLVVARKAGFMTREEARIIADVSKNCEYTILSREIFGFENR